MCQLEGKWRGKCCPLNVMLRLFASFNVLFYKINKLYISQFCLEQTLKTLAIQRCGGKLCYKKFELKKY